MTSTTIQQYAAANADDVIVDDGESYYNMTMMMMKLNKHQDDNYANIFLPLSYKDSNDYLPQ